jgi:transposase
MKKNQSYTAEFKAEAVKLVLEQKLSHQEAAQRVGIPKGSLSNWVASSQRRGQQALKAAEPSVAELKAEVSRLRRELARVEMEREIVKNILHGGCHVPMARNTKVPTLSMPDRGRQLFGGARPRQKTWPMGNLRTQLWWRFVRPRLGK